MKSRKEAVTPMTRAPFITRLIGAARPLPLACLSLMLAAKSSADIHHYWIQDLGTLGGSATAASGYGTINAAGQVVGYSKTAGDAAQHAFRAPATGVMDATSDLGTVFGTATSIALGINDSGQAVGYSYT